MVNCYSTTFSVSFCCCFCYLAAKLLQCTNTGILTKPTNFYISIHESIVFTVIGKTSQHVGRCYGLQQLISCDKASPLCSYKTAMYVEIVFCWHWLFCHFWCKNIIFSSSGINWSVIELEAPLFSCLYLQYAHNVVWEHDCYAWLGLYLSCHISCTTLNHKSNVSKSRAVIW